MSKKHPFSNAAPRGAVGFHTGDEPAGVRWHLSALIETALIASPAVPDRASRSTIWSTTAAAVDARFGGQPVMAPAQAREGTINVSPAPAARVLAFSSLDAYMGDRPRDDRLSIQMTATIWAPVCRAAVPRALRFD